MDLGYQGVHVLITGAGGGIGLETVKVFLELGATVTAHYNTSLKPLQEAFGSNTNVHILQAELTSEAAVQRLFSQVHAPVQVLIANHGLYMSTDVPLADLELSQWEKTMNANLTSTFLLVREYLRKLREADDMIKDKASVVMIGSTAGRFGEADHADYAASKSALMYGLTLSLKNEIVRIAPKGRVNIIAPGWVRTPMAEESLKNPRVVYQALATTPRKRFTTARDVANQVAIVAANQVSQSVSGEIITVAGGMEGRLLNRPEDIPADP
ncbi:NAD(P)-binding protein [Auriculariales sp. MPI-PUGE-AT-0066]|nr:NAD(P)-binding protein [Auriculariales sp. MPI-PUGE-AT-0066]